MLQNTILWNSCGIPHSAEVEKLQKKSYWARAGNLKQFSLFFLYFFVCFIFIFCHQKNLSRVKTLIILSFIQTFQFVDENMYVRFLVGFKKKYCFDSRFGIGRWKGWYKMKFLAQVRVYCSLFQTKQMHRKLPLENPKQLMNQISQIWALRNVV